MAKKPDDKNRPQPPDELDLDEFLLDEEPPAPAAAGPTSDSGIDLGAEVSIGSSADLSGVSVIEHASLTDEPSGSSAALAQPVSSPIEADFDDDDVLAADLAAVGQTQIASDDEVIDLGSDAIADDDVVVGAPSDRIVLGEVRASEGESGIDLMADDIVLEETMAAGESSRDLIAEGLESGVDLLGKGKAAAAAGMPDPDDVLDDFLSGVGTEDPTSSVDLGSAHSLPAFNIDEFDPSPASPPARSLVGEETVDIEDDGIDLGGLMADVEDEAPMPTPRGHVVSGPSEPTVSTAPAVDWGDDEPVAKKPAEKKKPAKPAKSADPDEKPAKEKPAKKGGGFVSGTLLGGVLGAVACLGAWTAGIDPPDALRDMVGTAAPKKAGPTLPPPGPAPAPVVPPAVALGNSLRAGDLDAIKPEDLAAIDEANAEQLTARAQVRWLSYVRQQRGKNLDKDAEPVKQAVADLDKAVTAGSADALFQRAEIFERTNQAARAKADYAEGAKTFAADADQKERFEAALEAMALRPVASAHPAAPLAVLLAFGYQMDDTGMPPPAPKLPPEPAPKFVRAIKLAAEGKYAEAIKAVDEAKAAHDERRAVLPNKPLSPRTDPREETFLRACDQVKMYFALMQKLSNPDYLTGKERDKAVDALLAKAEGAAKTALVAELGTKLVKDKPAATVDELVKLIEAERKAATDKVADLDGKLVEAKKDNDGLTTKLKDMTTVVETKDKALMTAGEKEKALVAANDAALTAMKEVGTAVGVTVTDLKAGPEIVKKVKDVNRVAAMADPKGMILKLESERDTIKTKLEGERDAIKAKLEGERDTLKGQLATRWEPAAMLGHWLPVVEAARDRTDLATRAMRDAELVTKDAAATPEQKAQARALAGLVARNRGQFDEAKTALSDAKGLSGPWQTAVASALRAVTDPAADVAQRAEDLAGQGKSAEALALLEKGLASEAGDKSALFAQRGRIALERARATGKVSPDGTLMTSARADAEAAAKGGAAEGHFLAGRIAEESKDWAEAEKQYRAAVAKTPNLDEAGARYRVALGRVLLRRSAGLPTTPRPLPSATRTGRLDLHGLSGLLTLGVYQVTLPGPAAATSEAEKFADEILAAGDKVPFDVRAEALAIKGLHTRALREYTTGLRDNNLLAARYANGLMDLMGNHPALRAGGDTKTVSDPAEADRHYAEGLRLFTAKRWADAERAFAAAAESDGSDARFLYYLGMARLAQGDRAGYEDFDRAAALERAGRPDRAAVSAALERVQGPMRAVLNGVRSRPK